MEISSALHGIAKCDLPKIQDNPCLHIVNTIDFYLPPEIKKISDGNEGTFILFSSPGAVGKTSLAKYIAYSYNALYWNVATDVITSNSFAGAVSHAFGVQNGKLHSEFYEKLKTGKALVVLDAFDEALLLSRREGVRNFLKEIGDILLGAMSSSVILTARTDTAKFIEKVCEEYHFKLRHYSIEYFDDDHILKFITGYLEANNVPVSSQDEKMIEKYIENVKKCISTREDTDEMKKEVIRCFMGYAQVLTLLSCQIVQALKSGNNQYKQIQHLSEILQGKHIIYDIIQALLFREQSKFSAFRDSIREKYRKKNKEEIVDSLYNKDEQLLLLQWYEKYDGEVSGDITESYQKLFPEDQAAYLEGLNEWLPQHIFLHKKRIMPIFQEYILAECLLDSTKSIDIEGGGTFISKRKLPTLAFAECYLSINNEQIQSEHIYYVVAAYYSQVLVDNPISCEITSWKDDEEKDSDSDLSLTFSYFHPNRMHKINPLKIVNVQSHPIVLNQVENMSVSINGTLELSSGVLENVEIRNSIIECDHIVFKAPEVCFYTYGEEENVLVVRETMKRYGNCKIHLFGTKNMKADLPRNGKSDLQTFHEFHSYLYKYDTSKASHEDSFEDFAYGLKKVLEQFKADRYSNDIRKFQEKIDNRCQTGIKNRVLNFLKSQKVLSVEGIFYQCNSVQMSNLQISRAAYMHFNDSRYKQQLMRAYDQYLQFLQGTMYK